MNSQRKQRASGPCMVAVLLILLLGIPAQPAYVQESPTVSEAASPGVPANADAANADAAKDAGAPAEPDAAATTAIDCTAPPAGHQARLLAENEIAVVHRWEDSNDRLRYSVLDASGSGLAHTVYESYNYSPYTNVRWPAMTTADLDGDGDRESVIAFRNQNKALAVRVPASGDYWYSANYGRHTGGLEYIDVAAGNLDRSANGDDEVIIAFHDALENLHLVGLNGDATGGIAPADHAWNWQWTYGQGGMGSVDQVSVATGDMDGDGYDDEIVVGFVDGLGRLHVRVFEISSAGLLVNVWGQFWTNLDRDSLDELQDEIPRMLKVTTGDVDGDFEDEVIVGFRDDYYLGKIYGKVQILILDRTGTWAFDDRSYLQIDPTPGYELGYNDWVEPMAVSVAAGDIDGDGKDEISLGYDLFVRQGYLASQKHTYPHLVTFDCLGPGPFNLVERDDSHWTTLVDPWDSVSMGRIETGDLDMDARTEIVLAFRDRNGDLQTLVFEGEDGLVQSRSYKLTTTDPGTDLGEFYIAMGDVNGDSSITNYTGTCYEAVETQVTSVLHIPPHYSAYNRTAGSGTSASFGKTLGAGGTTATSATTKHAGSVKLDMSVSFADIWEVGPSVSYKYEHGIERSNAVATMNADGLHISTDPGANIFDLVTYDKVTYWVYEYVESRTGTIVPLRIPKSYVPSSRRLDLWYSSGPAEFGSSWVPVGQNLALGRTATQSSTAYSAAASRAVDGNADGNYANGSVTHTNYQQYAWWQVDLGRIQWLDAVQLWNRTDCCGDRLSNFYVFVSDAPFASTNPNTLLTDPNVWHYQVTGQGGRPTTVLPNRSGRYIRVQLAGTNYLSLAEVYVWGHPAEVKDSTGNKQWPTERPTAIDDDTFQVKLPDGTYQTVNGQLQWDWSMTDGIQVDRGAGPAGWAVQDDQEWTSSTQTTTVHSGEFGFEVKVSGVGVEGIYGYGSETRTSREVSWSQGTVIEGQAGPLIWEDTPAGSSYNYSPYLWVQKAMSTSGVAQEFLVLDYWVGNIGNPMEQEPSRPAASTMIAPTAPLVFSPSHPDPATWVPTSTVVLTWTQPADDPATVAGYRWTLDSLPDTVPGPLDKGLITTHTYEGVADGVWYAHVRAMSDGYQWSETGHRTVRVDTNSPRVALVLDPPNPTGSSGWYNTPLTLTASASDGAGSGVVSVEMSTDGSTWQPYAPLSFVTDTVTTTVWARATDAVGHTSAPVSATFKLDLTPPSSKIQIGEYTIGVWVASVITDTLGNQHLVMGGVIDDSLSGRAGMDIEANGDDWTSASEIGVWHPIPGQPQIEVNWYYTATTELGRGNHIFYGQAQDEAGNLEEPYEIAKVIWMPPSRPELGASSVTVSPQVARPGDEVILTIVVRNSGQQEAQVSIVDTLPAGLTPVVETLGYETTYDPDSGTITWPARLVWPGEWSRVTFRARVDATGHTVLENQVVAHAFWPNTEALQDPARQYFRDHEDTAVMTATVTVNPDLPAGADVVAPRAGLGIVNRPQAVTEREVEIEIWADPDARWMFVREWTPDPITGEWMVAQDSGWMTYVPTTTWTLSAGDGVKYLGVWVADYARNVSLLDEGSLTYTNLVGNDQALPAGGRTQYRFEMGVGDLAAFYAATLGGDADLYVWRPLQSFRPNYWSNGPGGAGSVDAIVEWLDKGGRYLVEVEAVGDSRYQIEIADESGLLPERASQTHLLSFDEKDRPMHPLTISDPLSAGAAGSPSGLFHQIYLPLVTREAAR